jgi:hypothetical protein
MGAFHRERDSSISAESLRKVCAKLPENGVSMGVVMLLRKPKGDPYAMRDKRGQFGSFQRPLTGLGRVLLHRTASAAVKRLITPKQPSEYGAISFHPAMAVASVVACSKRF